jgi:hypothetical protein
MQANELLAQVDALKTDTDNRLKNSQQLDRLAHAL